MDINPLRGKDLSDYCFYGYLFPTGMVLKTSTVIFMLRDILIVFGEKREIAM